MSHFRVRLAYAQFEIELKIVGIVTGLLLFPVSYCFHVLNDAPSRIASTFESDHLSVMYGFLFPAGINAFYVLWALFAQYIFHYWVMQKCYSRWFQVFGIEYSLFVGNSEKNTDSRMRIFIVGCFAFCPWMFVNLSNTAVLTLRDKSGPFAMSH